MKVYMMTRQKFFQTIKRYVSTTSLPALTADSKITRIRIWKSGYFLENGNFKHTTVGFALLKGIGPLRRANIGHVSLETRDFYASLWPEQLTVLNKHKIQDGVSSDLEADLASEGRAPDHLVDMETLNLTNMLIELEKFESQNKYHLVGGNKVFNANNAASCSSLAYSLLIAGGIRKLVSPNFSIRDKILVTPNNLADMILEAKEKEVFLQREMIERQTFKK